MTQEQLAERSGLSPRTIQAIERGKVSRPHRESVRLLAEALELRGADRVAFEAAARGGTVRPVDACGACRDHPCSSLTDVAACLARHLPETGLGERVDLRGLGHTADPAIVLARLLRALGIDYGLAGSLVPNHTFPVQTLPA
jgi:transcriptional regulator with XRE-family HTH domain